MLPLAPTTVTDIPPVVAPFLCTAPLTTVRSNESTLASVLAPSAQLVMMDIATSSPRPLLHPTLLSAVHIVAVACVLPARQVTLPLLIPMPTPTTVTLIDPVTAPFVNSTLVIESVSNVPASLTVAMISPPNMVMVIDRARPWPDTDSPRIELSDVQPVPSLTDPPIRIPIEPPPAAMYE
jgi:hypothetical protein